MRAVLPRSVAMGVCSLLFALALPPSQAEEPETVLAKLFETSDLKGLSKKHPEIQIYRLTIIRSFHDPLQISLSQYPEGPANVVTDLVVKKARREVSGPEYRYTALSRNSTLKLKAEQGKNLRALLEAAAFWSMPTEDWRRQGLDGSTWTLEATRDGKYHKVVRDNPFMPAAEFEKIENTSDKLGYKPLTPGQAYGEGQLAAVFSYLWTLSGEDAEEIY